MTSQEQFVETEDQLWREVEEILRLGRIYGYFEDFMPQVPESAASVEESAAVQ